MARPRFFGLIVGLIIGVVAMPAQSVPDRFSTFEVASVRPVGLPVPGRPMRFGTNGGPGTPDPIRMTFDNVSLSELVMRAYGIEEYQLTAPAWMDNRRFDIVAKVPAGATVQQARIMLRSLLAERFKLATHHEQKEMSTFELNVAKTGHRLKEHREIPLSEAENGMPASGPQGIDRDGYPIMPTGVTATFMVGTSIRWQAINEDMLGLAARLSTELGRPVKDATGLPGRYDFTLSWRVAPGATLMGSRGQVRLAPGPAPAGGNNGVPVAATPEGQGPSLAAAIQQQLGLHLESKKGLSDVLVVDHAERVPTEN